MASQEFVSFIFTKENAGKFCSIREEMGLDDNNDALLEFFFKLHEKNKVQLKNDYLECEEVNIEVEETKAAASATDNADKCENYPVVSSEQQQHQYTSAAETLAPIVEESLAPIVEESTCDLSNTEPHPRLVDQESGETAKVLISLQDYQADDHTAATEEQDPPPQECVGTQVTGVCVGTQVTDVCVGTQVTGVCVGTRVTGVCVGTRVTGVCIDTSDIGDNVEGETTINIESQLINENLDQAKSIEIDPCSVEQPSLRHPSSPPPAPPATAMEDAAEKILDICEKSVQSLPGGGQIGEEFVVQSLEPAEVDNHKRKNSPKSNPSEVDQQKRKRRRNDVWLTRIQDADFEERRYKCHFCSAAFFHPHHLQRHEKQLHKMGKEVKANQCKDCFKTFATQLTLKFHQDFACRMVQRAHRCPQCQLGFKSPEEVDSHKCSGNPAKPLCCLDCDYRTGSPRDLEHHHRIHTGERCYKCGLCDFRTAWKKNLKEHVLKHSGLKPFVCHVCNFATNDRSNLRTHLAKHLKNKLNLCHTCGTSFRGSHSLESHMLLHSYATPHKCTYCDYSTRYKFSLKSHMRTHNVENNDANIAQIVATTTEDGTIQEVSEISVETTDPADYGELVEKQFYMCQECGFVIDNRKLYDSHKCRVRDSSGPTTTAVLDREMIIQIIESPNELTPPPPALVET